MTVSQVATYTQAPGNGSAVAFDFPFLIFETADLVVGFIDSLGNYVQQTSGFSVAGIGFEGQGVVTFVTPPAAGITVDIRSLFPNTQPTNFANFGAYFPETNTKSQDRLERQVQDLLRRVYTFGIHGPDTEDVPWPALPGPSGRAGGTIYFDPASGLPGIGFLTAINLTQSIFNNFLSSATIFPQTAAELAANVTPVNYAYQPGTVLRYANNTTPGTTDMAPAFASALLCNSSVYAPAGTYKMGSALQLSSGQVLFGDGGKSVMVWSNPDVSQIVGIGITNTTVARLNLQNTGTGSAATSASVLIAGNSSDCHIEECEISGYNYAGVWIEGSSNNNVRNNYFHSQTGGQQNSADIIVTNDPGGVNLCQQNVIEGNQCFGNLSWFGVCVQQFYGNTITPNYNLVANNRIGQKQAYGILFYNVVTAGENCNQAIGNYIENIQGNVLGGSAGCGIYSASQGGTQVVGNTIRNCCVLTSNATLTPAGIGINGGGVTPFVISGNIIINPQHYYGIEASGCANGGSITGNTITMLNGTPSTAIFNNISSNLSITGNTINFNNTLSGTAGIDLGANGTSIANLTVASNTILGAFRGIIADQTGGSTLSFVSITGNTITGGSSSAIPLSLNALQSATVSGNTAVATTVNALAVNACTLTRFTGNTLTTTGTAAVSTVGACNASYFDKSNYSNTGIVNAATGMIVEQFGSATPASGFNSAIGDRVEQLTPVVGNPKGWRCTVAGNPGTWVSEGNL